MKYRVYDGPARLRWAISSVTLIAGQIAWFLAGKEGAGELAQVLYVVAGSIALSISQSEWGDYKVRVYRRTLALDVALKEIARRDALKHEISHHRV